jgi:hypothetical protein
VSHYTVPQIPPAEPEMGNCCNDGLFFSHKNGGKIHFKANFMLKQIVVKKVLAILH